VNPEVVEGKQVIRWDNHISDRANCGDSFTTLDQYSFLLKTGAFHCILFDGSIIRSSFEFINHSLIYHSHLWWPAPYVFDEEVTGEYTPQNKYEDFLMDPDWNKKVRMRSPIRIDFDPDRESESHPLVHMHTQHYETRIQLSEPICFNKFIKYIFQNFYPDIEIDYYKWNSLKFTYSHAKVPESIFSSIVI
jgi:hypothetical protein